MLVLLATSNGCFQPTQDREVHHGEDVAARRRLRSHGASVGGAWRCPSAAFAARPYSNPKTFSVGSRRTAGLSSLEGHLLDERLVESLLTRFHAEEMQERKTKMRERFEMIAKGHARA